MRERERRERVLQREKAEQIERERESERAKEDGPSVSSSFVPSSVLI